MGVHGLTGFLKRLGIDRNDNSNSTTLQPDTTTLAIDGNGLTFHLFWIAYHEHRQNVLASFASSNNSQHQHSKELQSQLLLPAFTPLSLAHDITTAYLSQLTAKHGLHLKIFFDGPNQQMKRAERKRRDERREEEWENVRQLCINNVLPNLGTSKFRSAARRQAREYERRFGQGLDVDNSSNGGGVTLTLNGGELSEEEVYLASFPLSPLVMNQIEQSMCSFADIMGSVLPSGSMQIIHCEGEADAAVAKASADDTTGGTYSLGNDSDYLIYGYGHEQQQQQGLGGETKYIRFGEVDPSSESLCVGTVLTRSDVSTGLSLPSPEAIVELSILLGNDYTGPFVRDDDLDKRREYWESLKWYQGGESEEERLLGEMLGERVPLEDELKWSDYQGISSHVAEKVGEGWKLTSDVEELRLAIQFSYELYSFGDIGSFPSVAPGSTAEEDVSDDEKSEGEFVVFPSLPLEFDISRARNSLAKDHFFDISDVAILPVTTYMRDVASESNGLQYIEPRHLDAFKMTIRRMRHYTDGQEMLEPPQRKMQWSDMQSLYVLEKCLLEAIGGEEDTPKQIYQIFNHSIFHSCLESISYDDFPLDNELVSKNEKAFLEEVTSELPVKDDEGSVENPVLPIDAHKEDILHTVKTQRVTIIHGETGCGKSSRVPCFLLRAEPPEPTRTAPEVKMIISQPRRIAAKALAERVRSCEPDLSHKIALRMGHGLREHETSKTCAWFVTTGYVVRLLANHPGWFDSHTHLIIDEVHERSIDTDILCLLCRRLLQSHPTIRLVLMSATMAAELYSQYFGSPQPPIHVGARRFPIKEYFAEDLKSLLSLSPKNAKLAHDVCTACEKSKLSAPPSASIMEKLHNLATQITASVGSHGSSVLIFVPGMSDIEAIIELIERLNVRGVEFVCLPIHSDVPFEEQMAAFEPPQEGEVKVIIATNAAESSLTLPDVDHVVCLGLCKQIVYNRASHRQMLVPTWISRASATQRAGRTGRVREGNVYRLYSRNAFHQYMEPFDQGEMVRCPLDNTILSLRDMLDEAVTPILLECLEPPDISTIDRSYQSLHESNFISDPSDEGEITSLGSLVVALGIDLTLGSLVGLGIQFGVTAEAIQMAAILSFPKTPWAISSPMYHDTETFNDIVSKTFMSRCFFDAGLYSEPMAISNLLYDYSECKDRGQFCWKQKVSSTRMRHLYGTVQSLKQRVAERLGVSKEVLEMEAPPYLMPQSKVNILRILQVWLFPDTMIQSTAKNKIKCVDGGVSIKLDGPPITRVHLLQILDSKRHPFEVKNKGNISQRGHFDIDNQTDVREDFFQSLDIRFASYALENNIGLSYYLRQFAGATLQLFIPSEVWEAPALSQFRDFVIGYNVRIRDVVYLGNDGTGNQRGWRGRACGAWHPSSIGSVLESETTIPRKSMYIISAHLSKGKAKDFKKGVEKEVSSNGLINCYLSCNLTETRTNIAFTTTFSGECQVISTPDLCDLFASPQLEIMPPSSTLRQSIHFPKVKSNVSDDDQIKNVQPQFEDAPEGARLVSVLGSERRRDNFIRFNDGPNEQYIDVNLPRQLSINGNKWKRKGAGSMVFVPENCVPTASLPMDDNLELFGCCANTLDLRGGACRVEGITLLPPGRLFAGLASLCFGLEPRFGSPIDSSSFLYEHGTEEERKEGDVVREALSWIYEKEKMTSPNHQEQWRVIEALNFHNACMDLGEVLRCQPDKIKALCEIFDGVNGLDMTVWDGYDINLTEANANLRIKPAEKLFADKDGTGRVNTSSGKGKRLKAKSQNVSRKQEVAAKLASTPTAILEKKQTSPNEPIAASVDPSVDLSSDCKYACLGCGQIFAEWILCLSHRDKSEHCRDKKFKMKNSAAYAQALVSAGRAATPVVPSVSILKKEEPAVPIIKSSSSDSTKQKSKNMYACVGCNKIFRKWKFCMNHSEKCCPGERISLDEAAALANSSPNAGLSFELKMMWACPACNEAFLNKKSCAEHTDKCGFGLLDKKEPKQVWVCEGCGGLFSTPAEGGSHAHEGGKSYSTTPKFACLGCRQIFAEWRLCQSHRDKSEICRDKKFSMKNSESFAQALDANPLATPSPSAVTTKDVQATPETTLETSLPTAKFFMCPSCKEKFEKKKKCKEHIAKCNFGLVGHLNPMKFHVCSGCDALFETADSCRDHRSKGCWKLRKKTSADKTSGLAS